MIFINCLLKIKFHHIPNSIEKMKFEFEHCVYCVMNVKNELDESYRKKIEDIIYIIYIRDSLKLLGYHGIKNEFLQ